MEQKDQDCFTRCHVVGIACLDQIDSVGTEDRPDYDFHVSNSAAMVEPIPHKGKLMLYRTKIAADTPLDHPEFKTVGEYMRQFKK